MTARITAALLLCGLLSSLLPISTTQAAPIPFNDTGDTWFTYRIAIDALKRDGIIQGNPDGSFEPDEPINRVEFLTLVYREDLEQAPADDCFPDVAADDWFAPVVCLAYLNGIIKGYPDGTFRPGQTVNAAEAIKLLLLANNIDVREKQGQEWFTAYLDMLENRDIMDRERYLPWQDMTRKQAADLIYRFRQKDNHRQLRYSEGCTVSAATGAAPSSVVVNGEGRSFLLTVPSTASSRTPMPLIVAFHGRTNDAADVRSYFRLDREINDAIIAYPQAHKTPSGSHSWSTTDDVTFFDVLVERLSEQYCIDLDRIFIVGHSLGAWFGNSISCIRGDVIRASATLGGSTVTQDCAGPVASMIMHNPDDRLATFAGAELVRKMRIESNGCSWDTIPADPYLSCVEHLSCGSQNVVIFCPHDIDIDTRGTYYPHNWPRYTARSIKDFFESI